ncbi:MAG: hypothetical protein NXI12_04800 [Alphaproteobacteria bacterium]|nr:hypothetical protein [Alphaproteobacteria bacterium]
MPGLSDDKIARVSALMASLPGDMAGRMCAAARQGDPVLGRLLDYCRLGPAASARKRFFAPLADVSGDPDASRPSRAYAPEGLQQKVWDWLGEIAPSVIVAADQAAADFEDSAPGRLDEARVEAADAMLASLKAVEDAPKAAKKLRARLAVEDFEPVRHLAGLLRAAPVIRTALDGLPAVITDFNETLSSSVRDRYETASEADPDAAVWLLFLVMARMERPWALLRVFEKIARRGDDLLVSRTDMAEIGDALLRDAEHYLQGFARPPENREEAEAAARSLADFAAVTVGMTREIGIRKDGSWGKKLFELRTRASEQMTGIHEAARVAFKRATPEEGGVRRSSGPPPAPGDEGYEQACALGWFLTVSRDDAGRAAVGNAHQGVIDEINTRLESLADKLLRAAGGQGEQAEAAALRLEEVTGLMRAAGASQAAEVFLRRVAAARAA